MQGLFVCLPAEDLDVNGFAQHGRSDAMPPGPLLAEVVHVLAGEDGRGLAGLSDDQLVGVIAATRRLEARIAWTQPAAIREFAARRPAHPAGADGGRARQAQAYGFAADELAGELHLTWQSAEGHIACACAVADRLPRAFAALAVGLLHPVHVRIIEDETRILSARDAAAADQVLAEVAGSRTFGQLRSSAHRLVLQLDPGAAARRKQAARPGHPRPAGLPGAGPSVAALVTITVPWSTATGQAGTPGRPPGSASWTPRPPGIWPPPPPGTPEPAGA